MQGVRAAHAWLCLAAVAALIFLALAYTAEEGGVPAADVRARAFLQGERAPALERPMRLVTGLGSRPVLLPLGVVVLWALWKRDSRRAALLAVTLVGAPVFEGIAKWLVARPRPNLDAYGFPSGHTTAGVVFYGAFAYLLWTRRSRWRWAGSTGSALLVLAIGYSRVYLDAHWLTDVLGGLTGGGAYLVFAVAAFERFWPRWSRSPTEAARSHAAR